MTVGLHILPLFFPQEDTAIKHQRAVWNLTGVINGILLNDIPSLCVLTMVVLSNTWLQNPSGTELS